MSDGCNYKTPDGESGIKGQIYFSTTASGPDCVKTQIEIVFEKFGSRRNPVSNDL